MPLPANLPDIDSARLPALYEAAKTALAQCARIDECKQWSDRMEALASYARQSEDEALVKHAMRIKCRATDRCGEILHEIPAAKPGPKSDGSAATEPGRFQAAVNAGLSRDQAVRALAVNNVPRDQFEAMVESDNPPTVVQLAKIGRKPRPAPIVIDDHLNGRDPADFEQATRLLGALRYIEQRRTAIDLSAAIRGLNETERETLQILISDALLWLGDVKETIDV